MPLTPSQIAARVVANNDWIAYAKNLHRDECRRIGAECRRTREAAGKSLRRVAAAMGVSAPFLSDLERGNRLWTSGTMAAWEKAIT